MSQKKCTKSSTESLKLALDAIKHGIPSSTLTGKIEGIYPEECRGEISTILRGDLGKKNHMGTKIILKFKFAVLTLTFSSSNIRISTVCCEKRGGK